LETRLFRDEGWIGKLVGGNKNGIAAPLGKDTVEFLSRNVKPTPTKGLEGFVQRGLGILPQGIQSRLGGALNTFNNLPGVKNLSGFVKFSLLFEAISSTVGGIKDAAEGFSKTQGGILSKLWGGVQSGFKSVVKSIGTFAASTAAAVGVPLLLGISPLGAAGIIAGTIGSLVVSSFARKGLDKVIDTHSHTSQPSEQEVAAQNGNPLLLATQTPPDANLPWQSLRGRNPFMGRFNGDDLSRIPKLDDRLLYPNFN
jgi:hypothetical protein